MPQSSVSVPEIHQTKGDTADISRVESQVVEDRIEFTGVQPDPVVTAPVDGHTLVLGEFHPGATDRAEQFAGVVGRRVKASAEEVLPKPMLFVAGVLGDRVELAMVQPDAVPIAHVDRDAMELLDVGGLVGDRAKDLHRTSRRAWVAHFCGPVQLLAPPRAGRYRRKMSQADRPPVTIVDRRSTPPPLVSDENVSGLPGCGLAAYAVLLLTISTVGLTALSVATYSLTQGMLADVARGPSPLVPGVQTPVRLLSPMRKARGVSVDEVPVAFHDESEDIDGTVACAMMKDRLVKVTGETAVTLAYRDIVAVELVGNDAEGGEVRARTSTGLATACVFRRGEGVERMERQLRAEAEMARGAPLSVEPAPSGG